MKILKIKTNSLLNMKNILAVLGLLFAPIIMAQEIDPYWVTDLSQCPRIYNSVNCGADFVCGVNAETNFPNCSSSIDFLAPGFTAASNTSYANDLGGGYLINCHAAEIGYGAFCSSEESYFCNRDSSCNSLYRDTMCTEDVFADDAESFSCSETCQTGRLDCAGDYTEGLCNIRINITGYPVGSNNKYGSTCEPETTVCKSGYIDCDQSGTGDSFGVNAGTGNGCEVKYETSSGVSNPTPFNSVANNAFDKTCNAMCKKGFVDCDAGGVTEGNGCEVQSGVTSLAPNSTVGASCTSSCSGDYIDCDGSGAGAGDGCETLYGGICFINGLEGTVQGCSEGEPLCTIGPNPFLSGANTEDATIDPLLWGTQYGSGELVNISKEGDPTAQFTVENDGSVGIGTDDVSTDAVLDMSESNKGVLFPTMTTEQRDAIGDGNPTTGLLIFNMDIIGFEFYDGTTWVPMTQQAAYEMILYPGRYMIDNAMY